MGWLNRGRKAYFFESRRVGGKVVKTYRGSGPAAELLADLTALRRIGRRDQAEAGRRAREESLAVERLLEAWRVQLAAVTAEHLTRLGYHRQGRHPWRKKRMAIPTRVPNKDIPGPARQILSRAEAGDRAVHAEATRLLDGDPELARYLGDVASQAEEAVIAAVVGPDSLARQEAVRRWLADLVGGLEAESASVLESVQVRHVAACFLWVQVASLRLTRVQGDPRAGAAAAREAIHAFDRASTRLNKAERALAEIRRLRPARSPLELLGARAGGDNPRAPAEAAGSVPAGRN
jgi:hypothetical protein